MKTLTIRNIPNDLYSIIGRVAQRNRRSIQQQLLVVLDKMRMLDSESPVDKAAAIREHLSGRALGNTLKEIHEERKR
ncbi:MAG: hypothetical protein HOG03_15890 [Desulfobacula sp.]|jgi:plasmid stability protein|uniref:hypothetical protein n=1 Tax=Desulfobacula sp. TaxID=2593537 RepID=UPI001DDB1D22|nr:hypothetical protein [Desulfobacula sp.]MBT3487202.1 hypothetical protein [Desulfobacula sp.]MBT3806063.1 hypothetical protein [Desulfobacula sp.]MBT4026764.1 hypothetical protein [Desulfobacula sp.]MBT4199457.1 hypothetical protein [Desulfobacula sp.]